MIQLDWDMPTSCQECRFAVDGWCYALRANDGQPSELCYLTRPEWCPLRDAAPRWARCEERLPDMEGYDWVLGVVNGGCRNLKYENAIMEVSYDPEYKEWFIDDLPEAKINVTHWMPLPEPPGEDA